MLDMSFCTFIITIHCISYAAEYLFSCFFMHKITVTLLLVVLLYNDWNLHQLAKIKLNCTSYFITYYPST